MPTHLDTPPDLPWSRIPARAHWEDLVLPADVARELRSIARHWLQQRRLHVSASSTTPFGISQGILALFAGPTGTGKSMAAEALANELALELVRVDLSQVVSQHIDETGRNLGRLFDAAEQRDVLLLFDDADTLFGQRSEVRDSHDRYANAAVNHLLQRLEQFSGLAVLATNRRHDLDAAFIRRLHYVIEFPLPDRQARHLLWRHAFPPDVECRNLDFDRLAEVDLTGGDIRNIARRAILEAASNASPVDMIAVQDATDAELRQHGRTRPSGRR